MTDTKKESHWADRADLEAENAKLRAEVDALRAAPSAEELDKAIDLIHDSALVDDELERAEPGVADGRVFRCVGVRGHGDGTWHWTNQPAVRRYESSAEECARLFGHVGPDGRGRP